MKLRNEETGRFRSPHYKSYLNGKDGGRGFDATAKEHSDGTATARVESVGGAWWQETDCDNFEDAKDVAYRAFCTGNIPYADREAEEDSE